MRTRRVRIHQVANGEAAKQFESALQVVANNIADESTTTTPRKIIQEFIIVPSENRDTAIIALSTKIKLAQSKEARSALTLELNEHGVVVREAPMPEQPELFDGRGTSLTDIANQLGATDEDAPDDDAPEE